MRIHTGVLVTLLVHHILIVSTFAFLGYPQDFAFAFAFVHNEHLGKSQAAVGFESRAMLYISDDGSSGNVMRSVTLLRTFEPNFELVLILAHVVIEPLHF